MVDPNNTQLGRKYEAFQKKAKIVLKIKINKNNNT